MHSSVTKRTNFGNQKTIREVKRTNFGNQKTIREIKRTNFENPKNIREIKRTNFGNQKIIREIKRTRQESKHVIILVILLDYRSVHLNSRIVAKYNSFYLFVHFVHFQGESLWEKAKKKTVSRMI